MSGKISCVLLALANIPAIYGLPVEVFRAVLMLLLLLKVLIAAWADSR
jgi:hypothetical protein